MIQVELTLIVDRVNLVQTSTKVSKVLPQHRRKQLSKVPRQMSHDVSSCESLEQVSLSEARGGCGTGGGLVVNMVDSMNLA